MGGGGEGGGMCGTTAGGVPFRAEEAHGSKVPIIEASLRALWGQLCSKVFLKEGGREAAVT